MESGSMNSTAVNPVNQQTKTKGQLLREARIQARLTQQQLAQKSGVKRGQISQIESGRAGVTRQREEMLANALNLKVGFLATTVDSCNETVLKN